MLEYSLPIKFLLGAGADAVAFLVCLVTALRLSRHPQQGVAMVWLALSALFAALLAWRLVGGDEAFRQIMRSEMLADHSYGSRRRVQGPLVLILAALMAGAAYTGLAWSARKKWPLADRLALLVGIVLLAFSVIRAISFHAIDKLIYANLGPFNLNRVADALAVFAIIILAAPTIRGVLSRL